MSYDAYITRKLSTVPPTGIDSGFSVPGSLFPHQSALTAWAIRRGRAAIFADTGLGKSRMQLAWADAVHFHTMRPVLILAPLAVASQTVEEGAALGIHVKHCRDGAEIQAGINITQEHVGVVPRISAIATGRWITPDVVEVSESHSLIGTRSPSSLATSTARS